MERLTVKWKPKSYDMFDPVDIADNEYSKINFEKLLTKLGEYEDLEEQGLLLRLPCPVGTKVYALVDECEEMYEPSSTYTVIYEEPFALYMIEGIGKDVFLTREEAEAALAEKGGAE